MGTNETAPPAPSSDETKTSFPVEPSEPVAPATRNPLRRLYDWVLSLAERRHAGSWLGGLSFAEASFFPIPPDVLLIPLCLGSAKRAVKFAAICSVASVLGGAFGYLLGASFWQALDEVFYRWVPGFTPEKMERFQDSYKEWGWVIVFAAGFSPIPYKIFTIASGIAGMNIGAFLLASAISRSGRFFLVALLIAKFGEPMRRMIDAHFNKLALVFVVLLIGGFAAAKFLL